MTQQQEISRLTKAARSAAELLKALANEDRLLLLCLLVENEQSVSTLESLTGMSQPKLSQQLARLRAEGLVKDRRESKHVFYSLASKEAYRVLELMHELFCPQDVSLPQLKSAVSRGVA